MKSSITILGNKIDCFDSYQIFYNHIIATVKKQVTAGYITVNNVHTMIEGYNNPFYQKIINNGYLSIPDGKPLEIVGKLKGNKKISRLFGPSVMEKFIDWGRADNISHFFLGGSEENLKKLKSAIESKYPETKIAGMIAPPYKPVADWNNEYFIHEINKSKPNLIWVGLGAPKQERWMFDNHNKIDQGIMFGIGAGFDY